MANRYTLSYLRIDRNKKYRYTAKPETCTSLDFMETINNSTERRTRCYSKQYRTERYRQQRHTLSVVYFCGSDRIGFLR